MGRALNKLSALQVKRAGPGVYQDGGGLSLKKTDIAGKWTYRYSFAGKRRDMGLGSWPVVSLADARKARDGWAAMMMQGIDPIDVRRQEQEEAKAQRDRVDPTFAELVDLVFEARKGTLRGNGNRGRWRSPLDRYVTPKIGKKRASQLTQRDIADVLKPMWRDMYPTAEKAFQRTRIVLKSGKRMGFQCDPDIMESAKEILGAPHHVVQHMPSVPWQDVPALYERLGETTAGLCNRWVILTLVRLNGCKAAHLDEIAGEVWTVPAARNKGQKGKVTDFRVPLSAQAMGIVETAREFDTGFLFPGRRGNTPITDAAVEKCLRTLKAEGTPHGFRTSFRTWVQDTQACSWDVAETALDHQVGGKVERSYARSDMLDQRRVVMQKWSDFVTQAEAKVVKLRG